VPGILWNWKLSGNDLLARRKWAVFIHNKKQNFTFYTVSYAIIRQPESGSTGCTTGARRSENLIDINREKRRGQ
jgi:hypothetical protein